MIVALCVGAGVVVALLVGAAFAMFGEPSRCTGDALSGFLPCDNYPDCDCS